MQSIRKHTAAIAALLLCAAITVSSGINVNASQSTVSAAGTQKSSGTAAQNPAADSVSTNIGSLRVQSVSPAAGQTSSAQGTADSASQPASAAASGQGSSQTASGTIAGLSASLAQMTESEEHMQMVAAFDEIMYNDGRLFNLTGHDVETVAMSGKEEILGVRSVIFSLNGSYICADPDAAAAALQQPEQQRAYFDASSNSVSFANFSLLTGAQQNTLLFEYANNRNKDTAAMQEWMDAAFVSVSIDSGILLNGRSLLSGESIGAAYQVGGKYYICDTALSGTQLTIKIPYLHPAENPTLVFFITRGLWAPSQGTDYFAIGNSITIHPRRDIWPNAMGMGASRIECDYYHLLTGRLQRYDASTGSNTGNKSFAASAAAGTAAQTGAFSSAVYNFALWEKDPDRREAALPMLDQYLNDELEIVSVQLGENFMDRENFASAYMELIAYIRARCPHAQIVLIGNFWADPQMDAVKQQAATAYDAVFVDLTPIQGKSAYLFGGGTTRGVAYDTLGRRYSLDSYGTAQHPGNKGMRWIANAVYHAIVE